jgi:hypothetical protein
MKTDQIIAREGARFCDHGGININASQGCGIRELPQKFQKDAASAPNIKDTEVVPLK